MKQTIPSQHPDSEPKHEKCWPCYHSSEHCVIQEMFMFQDSKKATHVTLSQNPALERLCHRLNLLS